MSAFKSYKVHAATVIDDDIITEPTEAHLRQRLGDQKFDWLQVRGQISWKVFGVSNKGDTLIANCVDEASAKSVSETLQASVPASTVETIVELSVLFYGKAHDLSEAENETYDESMDTVEGQRGANDLIAQLANQLEADAETFGIEWGVDNDFYIVAETAVDAFFEEFMNRPDDIKMEAVSRKALFGQGLLQSERRAEIVAANIEELGIDPFIQKATKDGVVPTDMAFHLQVYFDAFADKAEDAYAYREFAGDREEEIINTFVTLDKTKINDWSYIEDNALNLCLELGEEANLDSNPFKI
jgi:hypothetical protein